MKLLLTQHSLFLFFYLLGTQQVFAATQNTCKLFPIGNQQIIRHISTVGTSTFSPDGKYVVDQLRDGTAIVTELSTGKEQIIRNEQWSTLQSAIFSPDSKSVITASSDKSAIIRNLLTGKEQIIKHQGPVNSAAFSPDGKLIVTSSDDGTAKILDLASGKEQVIHHQKEVNSASFSPDGKSVITASNDKSVIILNLESGKQQTLPLKDWASSAQFSPDGKSIVIVLNDGTAIVKNLVTKKEQIIQHQDWIWTAQFSPDGKSVVTASSDKSAIILDIATGKQQIIQRQDWIDSAQFSNDSKSILTVSDSGTAIIENLATGAQQIVRHKNEFNSIEFSPDGKSVLGVSKNGTTLIISTATTCADDRLEIEKPIEGCVSCRDNPPLDKDQAKILKAFSNLSLCREEFDLQTWDKELPPKLPTPISIDLAQKYLFRFQKPGGFESAKHLPILLSILKSDIPKDNPDLVLGALQNVLHESSQLYEVLLENYPMITKLKPASSDLQTCRTANEKEILKKDTLNYLKFLISKNPKKTEFSEWNSLAPLQSILKLFTPEQKDEWIDVIAQSLADNAVDSEEFHDVFLSKLYKFAYQGAGALFGEKPKELTDLTLRREQKKIRPLLLGVDQINDDPTTLTRFGFYAKDLPSINIDSANSIDTKKSKYSLLDPNPMGIITTLVDNQSIPWKMGDKSYQAKLNIATNPSKKTLIPEGNTPKYSELWSDGTLTGIVIAGSNLKGTATGVMNEYLAYYQNLGFEFQEKPSSIANVKNFLQEQIASGSVDYFIKEAHSDGDEKNLFRMDKTSGVQIGTKTNPDGKKEKIYLLFPDNPNEETVLLSNNEFGQWVRDREQKGKGQLVYFNTSCWSSTKALHEIEAAESPTLLNIAATTTVRTFANQPKSAEFLLFTAFRQKKNYEEMRSALKENDEYKASSVNVFIFPDEDKYQEVITKVLTTPLKIDLEITDAMGKPYEFDNIH